MIQAELYNSDGTVDGMIDLPASIFGRKWNPDLVHQVLMALESNRRKPWAHTKGRGEVRGGGRKPWRQKGTGRARHGSIRSPIWVGGGVAHGPTKERNFKKKINKKMRVLALFTVLSKKLADKEIKIVRAFGITEQKTKQVVKMLQALFGKEKPTLLLVPDVSSQRMQIINKAARNIPGVECISPQTLNVRDLLRMKYLVIEAPAIETIAKTFKV
jgi:large subunit ribosomal protein L4